MVKRTDRIGEQRMGKQGYLMTLVEYHTSRNIIVEFSDPQKHRVKTEWEIFNDGKTICWELPTVFNKGIVGDMHNKIPQMAKSKEYSSWYLILERCYCNTVHDKRPKYKECTICDEWLYFENFYQWLHKQSNYDVWSKLPYSAVDKDILIKGNKIYSPQTCCLVPYNVNTLFVKNDAKRGELPLGVRYHKVINKFTSQYSDPFNNNRIQYIGNFETPEEAFYAYKKEKERVIKQVAEDEYLKGTISKKCYDAMIKYQIEITD